MPWEISQELRLKEADNYGSRLVEKGKRIPRRLLCGIVLG